MDNEKTTARLAAPEGLREAPSSTNGVIARRKSNRGGVPRGFTLIEVLVALVILVIGIFALIELFPPGFLTLQISAEDAAANNLGRGELEQLASNNINQLGGIYALYSSPAGVPISYDSIDDPDQHVLTDSSLGLTSDIDAERAIQGETVRIPPAVSVAPESNPKAAAVQVSVYMPNFAPIQMPSTFVGYTINNATGQYNGQTPQQLTQDNLTLRVSSTPWTRIVGDSIYGNTDYADPNAEPAGGEPQYLIDYSAMKLAVGPEFLTAMPRNPPANGPYQPNPTNPNAAPDWYPQPFNFTVEGTDGDTYTAQFVWDPSQSPAPGNVPGYVAGTGEGSGCQWFQLTTADATWTNLTTGATGQAPPGWVQGTDVLSRDFHLVYNPFAAGNTLDLVDYLSNNNETFSGEFGNDPYSYALMDPELGTSNTAPGTDTNLGVIVFNPAAAKIRDSNGNPLMAKINYSAADWHVIHEDHTLGIDGGQNPTVRLYLKDIYQIGSALPDNSLYTGIVNGMTSPTDVEVVDLDNGQATSDTGHPASLVPDVDYNNGVVTFPSAAAGDHVRILYKATGDWGMAVIKAPASYTQRPFGGLQGSPDAPPPDQTAPGQAAPAAGTAIPPVGTFEIEQSGGQNTTRLLFPGTDIGKQVRITNVVAAVTNQGNVTYHDANVRTIQPDPTATYDVVMNGHDVVEHLRGYVDLASGTTPANPDGNLGVLPTGSTIVSVGSVVGSSITARVIWKDRNNWRYRDVTTLVAPAQ